MDLRLIFAVLLWTALAVVATLPALRKSEPTKTDWNRVFVVFLLLLGIALPVWRLRSLLYNGEINVDESQLLSQVLRYRLDPIPWRGVDGGSSGPLNTWALLWAPLFGLKIDYFVARVTGLFCVWSMLAGLALALSGMVGRRLALILTMPAVTLLLTAMNFDYVFFSSEQLPMAIVTWAICLLASPPAPLKPSRFYAVGFLTGSLPFCKIQVGPAAFFVWGVAAFIIFKYFDESRQRARASLALVLGGLSVPLLILAPVFLAGAGNDFLDLYIKAALHYKQTGSGPSWSTFWQLIQGVPEFHSFFLVCTCALIGALPLLLFTPFPWRSQEKLTVLGIVGLTVVVSASIYRTGFAFPHYTLLLITPFSLLAAAPFFLLKGTNPRFVTPKSLSAVLLALTCVLIGGTAVRQMSAQKRLLADWGEGVSPMGEILRKFAQPNDTMFVWGFAPKYYVASGLTPATRFAVSLEFLTTASAIGGGESPKNLGRLLGDLERYKPALFVDAPDEFWFPDPATPRGVLGRHSMVSPIAKIVSEHYRLVQQVGLGPGKVPVLVYKRNP